MKESAKGRFFEKGMEKAKYSKAEKENIVKESEIFKRKFKDINDVKSDSEEAEVVTRFEHLLFKTHLCQTSCIKVVQKERGNCQVKVCPERGKVVQPREPRLMRLLHLFCKEPSLYMGVKNFLHLLLRYYFIYCTIACKRDARNAIINTAANCFSYFLSKQIKVS